MSNKNYQKEEEGSQLLLSVVSQHVLCLQEMSDVQHQHCGEQEQADRSTSSTKAGGEVSEV